MNRSRTITKMTSFSRTRTTTVAVTETTAIDDRSFFLFFSFPIFFKRCHSRGAGCAVGCLIMIETNAEARDSSGGRFENKRKKKTRIIYSHQRREGIAILFDGTSSSDPLTPSSHPPPTPHTLDTRVIYIIHFIITKRTLSKKHGTCCVIKLTPRRRAVAVVTVGAPVVSGG